MIGWYIHHHGRGHLTRAMTVQAHVDEPVVALSSLPRPAEDGFADWIVLERDDGPTAVSEATAQGRLHWAPVAHLGLARRNAEIAEWIATRQPRVMVVDVSVEVMLLARLCGVRVIAIAGPGERGDAPHQLGYDIADHIIAAWPRQIYEPSSLRSHSHKTSYVGAISRFDGLAAATAAAAPAATATAASPTVVVLNGAGGSGLTLADVRDAQAAVPQFRWTALGLTEQTWVEDVWSRLSSASVVVSHGGQNSIAECAAAARPTVVVAQERPFGEQRAIAHALDAHGIAIGLTSWPAVQDWPSTIDAALALGGAGWSRWASGNGAAQAASIVAGIAR